MARIIEGKIGRRRMMQRDPLSVDQSKSPVVGATEKLLKALGMEIDQAIADYKRPLLSEAERSRLEETLARLESSVREENLDLVGCDEAVEHIWMGLLDKFIYLRRWQAELKDANSDTFRAFVVSQDRLLAKSNQNSISIEDEVGDGLLPTTEALSKTYQIEHGGSDGGRQPHDKGRSRQRDAYRTVANDQQHLPVAASVEVITTANREFIPPLVDITDLTLEDLS